MPFMQENVFLWIFPLAVALDMLLGDPPEWPLTHPARRIGRLLDMIEPETRRLADVMGGRFAGALALCFAAGLTGAAVWLLAGVLPGLWAAFSLYFAYAGLALGELLRSGAAALAALEGGTLPEAQAAVQMLVSRDASAQDRETLYRSLAESLAENVGDAVLCPLFWLCLAGPAGLWTYKAVSTADSMWGYKTPRWKDIGWAGARLDDALAWIPARLAALFLYLAALTEKNRAAPLPGLRRIIREARSMESPNSGWPMSVAAWTRGAGMGGPTVYFGEVRAKPPLGRWEAQGAGPPLPVPWDAAKIRALLRQIRLAGLLAAASLYAPALAAFFISRG